MRKVLLVEDNLDIAQLIQVHAKDIDCDVDIVSHGDRVSDALKRIPYQLIVLDLMLPGRNGLDLCRDIRQNNSFIPVIILTSRASEYDRVLGLEFGADDYVTKPFSILELLARFKAQLRRVEQTLAKSNAPISSELSVGELVIDPSTRYASSNGKALNLTVKEFDLLLHFVSNPSRVFSRNQLLEVVWGYHYEGYEHTVNSHINRLRAKIETDPTNPTYIQTVWGVGYKLGETF